MRARLTRSRSYVQVPSAEPLFRDAASGTGAGARGVARAQPVCGDHSNRRAHSSCVERCAHGWSALADALAHELARGARGA
eukprot:4028153-Prymnesium_polylepis.1